MKNSRYISINGTVREKVLGKKTSFKFHPAGVKNQPFSPFLFKSAVDIFLCKKKDL